MKGLKHSMTSRPSTAAPILAVLAVSLVALGSYLGLYFSLLRDWRLGSRTLDSGIEEDIVWRVCEHSWQTRVFAPAARFESLVRMQHVELFCWSDVLKQDDDLDFSIDAAP
jgi:hypothetical protein